MTSAAPVVVVVDIGHFSPLSFQTRILIGVPTFDWTNEKDGYISKAINIVMIS